MFNHIGQVMLYVSAQDTAVTFWTEKLGFSVIDEENRDGMRWIELAPSIKAETTIILHDKETVAKISPELNLGTPSLMFFTDKLDQLYADLVNKNVTVGEIMDMPTGRAFNFSDNEDNYFAVMEQKI